MSSSSSSNMNNQLQQQHQYTSSSSSSSSSSSKHKRKNYHQNFHNYHNRYLNNLNNNSNTYATNCIILKNLHYNMTEQTLTEVIQRVMQSYNDAKFTSLQLVDDKHTGTFKGIAFVSFSSIHHASIALNEMNKVAINGRKVFAEYRRVPKHQQNKISATHNNNSNNNSNSTNESNQQLGNDNSDDKIVEPQNEQVDKRALFFANRGNEKEKVLINKFSSNIKDKEKEDFYRNLLLNYSQGNLTVKDVKNSQYFSVNDNDDDDNDDDYDIGNDNDNNISATSNDIAVELSKEDCNDNQNNNNSNGIDMINHDNSVEMSENHQDVDQVDVIEDEVIDRVLNVTLEQEGDNDNECETKIDDQESNKEIESNDVIFDSSLSSYDRRLIHMICEQLNLGHMSRSDDAGRRVLHVTKDKDKAALWASEAENEKEKEKENSTTTTTTTSTEPTARVTALTATATTELRKNRSILLNPNNVNKKDDSNGNSNVSGGLKRLNYTRPRGAIGADGESGSGLGLLSPSYKVWTPKRQPTGPPRDGKAKGFERRREFHGIEVEYEKEQAAGTTGKESNGSVTSTKSAGKGKGKGKGKGAGKEKTKDKELKEKVEKFSVLTRSTPTPTSAANSNNNSSGSSSTKSKIVRKSKLDPNVPPFSPMNNQFSGTGTL